jgi:hypothetical protein
VRAAESERTMPGATAQQALVSGTVDGRDARRRIGGEAAAAFPLRHRLRLLRRQQTAASEQAQWARTYLRLYRRDGLGIDPGRGIEDHTAH